MLPPQRMILKANIFALNSTVEKIIILSKVWIFFFLKI